MFKQIAAAAQGFARLYGAPGAGVTVVSAPDSVLDFYRMSNVRLPDPQSEHPAALGASQPLRVLSGDTAVRQTRLTMRPSGQHSTCSEC